MLIWFACGCLLPGLISAVPAQARRDPNQQWRSFRTPHFEIIYPNQAGQAAARASEILEQTYPKVATLLDYAPPGRTPIVMNANDDLANGYAQGIFRKLEFVLANPLTLDFGPRDPDWMESLAVHEFAHLCFGLRETGVAAALAAVFGDVNGLNFVAPKWWVEGVAVYAETKLTSGGRGRNPYTRMELAAQLLSQHPWSLAQIGVSPRFAPPWDRVYLAGQAMLSQVMTSRNDEVLGELADEQTKNPWLGLDPVWQEIIQTTPGRVWDAIVQNMGSQYAAIYGQDQPAMPGVRQVAKIEHAAFANPQWMNSDEVAALLDSQDEPQALVRVHIASGRITRLFAPEQLHGRFSADAQSQKFFYSRLLQHPVYTGNRLADLFEYSTGAGERCLTQNSRMHSPQAGPDRRMVAVLNRLGWTQLCILEPSGEVSKLPAPPGAVYASPCWSPDGRQLVATVTVAGIQDICLVDPSSGGLTPLTGWDAAADFDPTWSPDGKEIYFVSDRAGAHQIFSKDLASGNLYQISHAYFGAFSPAVSPDGRQIAFVEYRPGNRGVLMIAPLDKTARKSISMSDPQPQPASWPQYALPAASGRAYSAWPYLAPSFWIPWAQWDENGIMAGVFTARQDPLELHAWTAQALYQPATGQGFGECSYTNRETPAELTVTLFQRPLHAWHSQSLEQGWVLQNTTQRGCSLEAGLPLLLGQSRDYSSMLVPLAKVEFGALSGHEVEWFPDSYYQGFTGGLQFSRHWQTPLDLFPISGYDWNVFARAALPGRNYNGRMSWGGAQIHLPSFFQHHAWVLGFSVSTQQGMFPDSAIQAWPRGYADHYQAWNYAATVSCGYRLPLVYIDQGLGMLPVFAHAGWMEVWADHGRAWGSPENPGFLEWWRQAQTSVSASLHADLEILWYLPARASLEAIYQMQPGHGRIQAAIQLMY